MRVHVRPDPVRDRVDVYVDMGGGYWQIYERGDVALPAGANPPAYLSLPTSIAQQMKGQLEGQREPPTERHLSDAVAVRDRLLTLVETQWARNR